MKREDFKKVIKLRSFWKIDRRKGNYKLPNGKMLSDYITSLVESQMKLDNLAIREKIDRTTTLIDVVGGYSKEKKKMVMVSFTMNQYSQLTSLISNIDKDAFMTIHRAHEINGKGFSKNKEAK